MSACSAAPVSTPRPGRQGQADLGEPRAERLDRLLQPPFSGVGLLDDQPSRNPWRMLCRGVTREFRRKVLDLVAAGRPVAQVAHDLQISAQVIYTWRRQQLIDSGQVPGMNSSDHAQLVAARKRIAELENELAIHRRAAELLGDVVPPKGATRRSC